jgi:hypothetical protein
LFNRRQRQVPAAKDLYFRIQLPAHISSTSKVLHLLETELRRDILGLYLDVGLRREGPLRKSVDKRSSQETEESRYDHNPASLFEKLNDSPERIFIVVAQMRSTIRRKLRDGYGRVEVLIFSYYQINILEITSNLSALPMAARLRTRTFQKTIFASKTGKCHSDRRCITDS